MDTRYNKKALLNQFGVEEGDDQMGAMGEPGGWAGPAATGAPAVEPPKVEMPGALPSPLIMEDVPPMGAPPQAPASNYGRTMGFDEKKWNDPNKKDFKYDTGRLLSRFDPKAGFTPEVIDALNKELGGTYGTFSGGGDKLSLTGAKGAKDAADFANQDWIYALKAGNDATKWNFGGGGVADAEARAAGGGAPGGGMDLGGDHFGGAQLDSALSGDPLAKIQQLIAQMSGSRPNFAALMQQLGGQ